MPAGGSKVNVTANMDGLGNTIRTLADGDYAEHNAQFFIGLLDQHDFLRIAKRNHSKIGQGIDLEADDLEGWSRHISFFNNGIIYGLPGQDPLAPQQTGKCTAEQALQALGSIEAEVRAEIERRKVN